MVAGVLFCALQCRVVLFVFGGNFFSKQVKINYVAFVVAILTSSALGT
jgi:hypothetical protein